jgi:uncharacterized membrane protein YebE (DUF533 family)
MDAIDILGSLLGRKSGGSGMPDLSEIFGQREAPAPQRREAPTGSPPTQTDLQRQAKELEDLLNVARDRDTTRRQEPAPRQPSPSSSTPKQSQPTPTSRPSSPPASRPAPRQDDVLVDSPYAPRGGAPRSQNDQALVLVRAMLNAAKADGRVSAAEQQSILEQVAGDSTEVTQFVRDELSQPLDVREFAWSVPLGMEEQVYAMSLLAIDVDEQAEQRYLGELAHGLRIPDEVCDQLQQRYRRKPR